MFLRAVIPACTIALLCIAAPARSQQNETVECRSSGYNYTECVASFRHPQLVQQLSDSECVENRSWGVKRNGMIWVSAGCAAIFADSEDRYSRRGHDDDADREGNAGRDDYSEPRDRRDDRRYRERPSEVIECRSRGYALTRCEVNWNNARLLEQLSTTSCIEGENWGLDEDGLWVDKGCGGRFAGE
jgi:hypothetical protein